MPWHFVNLVDPAIMFWVESLNGSASLAVRESNLGEPNWTYQLSQKIYISNQSIDFRSIALQTDSWRGHLSVIGDCVKLVNWQLDAFHLRCCKLWHDLSLELGLWACPGSETHPWHHTSLQMNSNDVFIFGCLWVCSFHLNVQTNPYDCGWPVAFQNEICCERL